MPLLRTTEKIFIGYSIPQLEHKETAERVITGINAANRHKHIQLYVCEYRQMVIDDWHVQPAIDRVLEDCDLVVLLFGADVGAGLAWEARHSLELFKTGKLYKLLPYVFTDDAPRGLASSVNSSLARAHDVEHFYESEDVLYYKIPRADAFEDRFRNHIEVWLAEEERIVERQRDFLKRGLLRHFAIDDVAFGDEIIAIQERDKGQDGVTAQTTEAYRRYVEAGDDDLIREEPVDYYLIARHLRDAALRDKPEVAARAEFINPIHQFLAAIFRNEPLSIRDTAIRNYEQWLRSKSRLGERTRSFAAFQLGMLRARESVPLLIETARNRGELRSVRHYAIYALGMLRQRSMIVPLMDVHSNETDAVIRDALTNSILFMMGVTE
jgi:hypothetical protein